MIEKAIQYKQSHDLLMKRWKERHERLGYSVFIKDGVIDPEVWYTQDERILFILKEAYTNEEITENADLTDDLKKYVSSKGRIWNAVAEWTYGLTNTAKDTVPYFDNWLGVPNEDFEKYKNARADILKKCAVINIKKSNGKNTSDDIDLLKYVKEDGDLLARQIEIIDPTIIVCGSTFHLLKDVKKDKNVDEKRILKIFGEDTHKLPDAKGCYTINGRPVIAYYHPANQYPAVLCFYGITGIYHHYLKNK